MGRSSEFLSNDILGCWSDIYIANQSFGEEKLIQWKCKTDTVCIIWGLDMVCVQRFFSLVTTRLISWTIDQEKKNLFCKVIVECNGEKKKT